MIKKIYFLVFLFLFLVNCFDTTAQNILKGTVKDAVDKSKLAFVQILVRCNQDLVFTNNDGGFSIELKKDSCELEFSMNGLYQPIKQVVVFPQGQKEMKLDILLHPETTLLGEVNILGSKYQKNPDKSINSLVVLTPKHAENRNFTSVDNLVNTAGGIVIVDNEPQIRGGSGYSSGMGSRVMILLDNMPMLRPDAGRPMWNFIPMESIEQVEILKGAASVTFGSSALTGAINVLTAYPRSKPQTTITVFGGMYDKPENRYQTSWHHQNPLKGGLSFLHSRIIRKNFDLVVGGEYFNDQSYIGPDKRVATTKNTDSTTLGKYDIRYRLNFAGRYRFAKVKGLSVSLSGNFMYSDNTQSYLWFDADTNIFRTYKGSLSHYKDYTFYIDPVVNYLSLKGDMHTFRNRILYSNSNELTGAQSSQATMYFDEYQYNKSLPKIGLNIVAGITNIYTTSFGPVFSGGEPTSKDSMENSGVFANNNSIYLQLEEKILKKKNLTFLLGGRWEFFNLWGENITSEFEHKPIFKAGINYSIPLTKTAFRASFGQGYRFPTIGEKFISLTVGDYGFYPNPELKPETSWNAEIGLIQPFAFFNFRGVVDIAYFHQEFQNFIEFCMGPWASSDVSIPIHKRLGYKFLNIGPAIVNGIDLSLMGEGKISKNTTYTLMLSYTWSRPVTKDPDYAYYTWGAGNFTSYTFNNSSSDTTRNVLKYRIENMAKLDLQFTFVKSFTIGFSANYYSAMKNIDKFMLTYDISNPELLPGRIRILKGYGDLPFNGLYNFLEKNKNGSLVFDGRMSYSFDKLTISFIVKNIFNRLYALRPLYIEPTRTMTFQFVCKI